MKTHLNVLSTQLKLWMKVSETFPKALLLGSCWHHLLALASLWKPIFRPMVLANEDSHFFIFENIIDFLTCIIETIL